MYIVSPIEPVEVELYTWPNQPAAQSMVIAMDGWLWFQVRTIEFTLNNAGGAAAANPVVLLRQSNQVVANVQPVGVTGIGLVATHLFGLQCSAFVLGTTYLQTPLPEVYIGANSTVQVSFVNGDAATFIGSGAMVVVGRRLRTQKKT